jgi:hypothetical protein
MTDTDTNDDGYLPAGTLYPQVRISHGDANG